jgi:hypothetical protein
MSSFGLLRCVTLLRTDVSQEPSVSIIVHRFLVTANIVHSSPILLTLTMEALGSS